MIDIKTHKIIDMINSRELKEVTEWLKTFPNIKVVSRDGSITYNNAIAVSHPDAIQVSDRFHILKNLTKYCKDYIVKIFKNKIEVELPVLEQIKEEIILENLLDNLSVRNKKLTFKEKCDQVDILTEKGYCKTVICKMLNMDIRTLEKIKTSDEKEMSKLFKNKSQLKHEENVSRKQEKIDETIKLSLLGFSMAAISRELEIDKRTVKKYLDPNFSPIHVSYGETKDSILSTYYKEIDNYIEIGYTSSEIEKSIRQKGYEGSASTLRNYMIDWKRNRKSKYFNKIKEKNIKIIERKNLIKLLFKPIDKIKELNKEILEYVNIQYPVFVNIVNLVKQFRQLLLNKNVNKLDPWIEFANSLEINEVNSFVNGISRDLTAVKNAIIFDYNNGLAEGSVNKLKVIKRIMYGRCNFETLRRKVLRLELRR